jgi:UDP-N-acetylmuramoyl-tripeptide--D-alanyl-D-alanine ligase
MFVTTEDLYPIYQQHPIVCTDTRQITPGCLFFGLKGAQFDGNQYAQEALSKGAAFAIVDDESVAIGKQFLRVENVLESLQDLARHHRKTFTFPVIALTGSNGKTTTKELVSSVLSMKYNTFHTDGNKNNHIGVPLTLLAIDPTKHEMAVVEMGANHQGEIALLCTIAMPNFGLITNIGKAHLEGFGGLKGVMKGKGELLDYLSKKQGKVFVNVENDTVMELVSKRRAFGEIIFYRSENSPVNPVLIQDSPVVIFKGNSEKVVTTHLPGTYNFDNICAALAIGNYFEVEDADAYEAIANYIPDNNRSQIIKKGSNTVLLDAYNANPSSMAAAIENFHKMDAPKKVVILGDMLELGTESEIEHLALGELIARYHFDTVILCGHDMKYALPALPKAYYIPDKFSLHNWIMDNPLEHTHILIKGSRGMALETVLSVMAN